MKRIAQVAAAVCVAITASIVVAPTAPIVSAFPPGAPRVTLLGDSTMMGMRTNNTGDREVISADYDLLYDGDSCRRLVIGSCRGRFGYTPKSALPLMQQNYRGQLGQVLVIMTGYNDWSIPTAIDQIMAEATAQGVWRVVWLTYRTGQSYDLPGGVYPSDPIYIRHNQELRAALARHPNLELLDWNAHAAGKSSWFYEDGVHLRPAGSRALAEFIKDRLDSMQISRCQAANANTGFPDVEYGNPPFQQTPETGFVGVTPARVLDTRDPAQGGANGRIGAQRTVEIDLDAVLPPGATSAVMNVVAVDPCREGYLTVFACGLRPLTSNVNYYPGRTTAAVAISTMTDRKVCIYAHSTTDVVVDVTGAFVPGGEAFHQLGPVRWVDTRGGTTVVPSITGLRASQTEVEIPIAGQGGIPSDATGVWLNLTVTGAATPAVVSVYPGPCGSPPFTSNVNSMGGRSTASSALVGLGSNGSICVRNFIGASHLVVDVAGWFGPGEGGLAYRGQTSQRLLDTREVGGRMAANTTRSVDLAAVSVLNVAAITSTSPGYVAVRPCGSTQVTSLINTAKGETIANLTAVAPGASNQACLFSTTATDMIADLVGTFVPIPG